MQYTTGVSAPNINSPLSYQDFKDTLVCNTQLGMLALAGGIRCLIKISKILLYAIHNQWLYNTQGGVVVLSGFQ